MRRISDTKILANKEESIYFSEVGKPSFWIKRLEGSTLLSLREGLLFGAGVRQSAQAWRVPDPFLNWRTTNLQKDLAYALLRAVA
jgi:hypothetical protein